MARANKHIARKFIRSKVLVNMSESVKVVLQARMSSTRLPGKVLRKINNQPMIYWQIHRILQSKKIKELVVAISDDSSDDVLADYLNSINQKLVRGSLHNVLDRFIKVEEIYKSQVTIRLTADCPLVMPELIDQFIGVFLNSKADYLSNTIEPTYPDGLDIEIFRPRALEQLSSFQISDLEKEHVTLGIINRKEKFKLMGFQNDLNLSHFRWTVDDKRDFEFVSMIYQNFKNQELTFNLSDLLDFFRRFPGLNQIVYR